MEFEKISHLTKEMSKETQEVHDLICVYFQFLNILWLENIKDLPDNLQWEVKNLHIQTAKLQRVFSLPCPLQQTCLVFVQRKEEGQVSDDLKTLPQWITKIVVWNLLLDQNIC